MNVGDRVKTTAEWNKEYYNKGAVGTVLQVAIKGPNPHKPERNIRVVLDYSIGAWERLWFDPEHLEPEDG